MDVENNLMNHLERISTFGSTVAHGGYEDSQIPLLSEKAALLAFGIYSVMHDSTILLSETVIEESISYLLFCLTPSNS